MLFQGHIVDILNRRVFAGEIEVAQGKIVRVDEILAVDDDAPYYLPGFIDSHLHLESTMMTPGEIAYFAARSGTVGIVCDPHDIANVLGMAGVELLMGMAEKVNFNFWFGAPSCVPSTDGKVETNGARLDVKDVERLLARDDIHYLSEVMNYAGVIGKKKDVLAKIEAARRLGKPVDGHAPTLVGKDRARYASAGISTDHECTNRETGRSCIESGMFLQIREGSASKNFDSLIPLLREYPGRVMFCTDDRLPVGLVNGGINLLVARALRYGYDLWDVLMAACITPQLHYGMEWGMLRPGDPATFIGIDRLDCGFRVLSTLIGGAPVERENFSCCGDAAAGGGAAGSSLAAAGEGASANAGASGALPGLAGASRDLAAGGADTGGAKVVGAANLAGNGMAAKKAEIGADGIWPNKFEAKKITEEDIRFEVGSKRYLDIINAADETLLTGKSRVAVNDTGYPWDEVQKIVVYNRYNPGAKPAVGLIRGFEMYNGAMASSVGHDSHNIVAIGSSDEYIVKVINRLVELRGGNVAICGDDMVELPLPIAGLISPLNGEEIARLSIRLNQVASHAGCTFRSPLMTMSFMCLPVIPTLKITDKGLVEVK